MILELVETQAFYHEYANAEHVYTLSIENEEELKQKLETQKNVVIAIQEEMEKKGCDSG